MSRKIAKLYFSPTGNTQKCVNAMADAIPGDRLPFDISLPSAPACQLDAEDFAVIGMPVYGGRIPTVALSRMAGFRGSGTPCIVLVTYGNRHYDDALLELAELVQAQGFVVQGAAALVGRHTYGDIQASRPDADDLAACAAFAAKACKNTAPVSVPGSNPYRDGGGGGGFRPLTTRACTKCGICVKRCPTQAIAQDCKTIDDSLCIACFRCIRICPENAKHMNTKPYRNWAAEFSRQLKKRHENEFFL